MKRSKEVRVPLLVASVAALLTGCDDQRFSTKAECEKISGAGNCTTPPAPVGMTAANRPEYANRGKCEADFGNEKCDKEMGRHGGAVYRPIYVPGQTFWYPHGTPGGYFGYYGGRHDFRYTTDAASKPFVNKTSSLGKTHVASRGGFGSVGRGIGAGRGG